VLDAPADRRGSMTRIAENDVCSRVVAGSGAAFERQMAALVSRLLGPHP
jgi:hypothetical protein